MLMQELALEFPQYNWQKNAGYGTQEHINAIKKYGICRHHRRNFDPIKQMINSCSI